MQRAIPSDRILSGLTDLFRSAWIRTAFLIVVLFSLTTTVADAAAFTVTTGNDGADAHPGDGVCGTALGACTLRAAVMEANARLGEDTISVPAGTYLLTIAGRGDDSGSTGDLDVFSDLTIIGAGSGSTIVDANGLDRAFHVLSGSVSISGVTVRGGRAPGDSGGGIRNETRLLVSDLVLTENAAEFGGGISSGSRNLVSMTNVVVRRNTADFGGGVLSIGPVSMRYLAIEDNVARFNGAGLDIFSCGAATIGESTVSGNRAGDRGGGVIVGSGLCPGEREELTLTNVTISSNQAARGGGLWIYTTPDTAPTTFVRVVNSTLADNRASQGGGLANVDQFGSFGSLTVRNSVVARNTQGGDCAGRIASEGGNLSSDASCTFTVRNDQQRVDPKLGPLAQNGGQTKTHALLTGSSAIDAGVAPCPATDQRGLPRTSGASGACDSGAYEAVIEAASASPTQGANDDKPTRKLTTEQRRQRQRTNQSGHDDRHTEGDVLEVHLHENEPYVLIGTRDGTQRVVLRCDGGCPEIDVGDYLEAEGEKIDEELFVATDVTVSHR